MDIVKNPNVNWLKFKWIFIGISFCLALVGSLSLALVGLNMGIDFTGGTLVYVKFLKQPQLDRIRAALSGAGLAAQEVIRFDELSKNEVQIRMGRIEGEDSQDLTLEGGRVFEALHQEYDQDGAQAGKLNLNRAAKADLSTILQQLDPEKPGEQSSVSGTLEHYDELAARIIDYRTESGGIIGGFSELEGLSLPPSVQKVLQEETYLGRFSLISVESVGPKVGQELRTRASYAIFFSLAGMLLYIAFRFRTIYGLAALVALFHDVFITIGAFSVTRQEISLTVVAAILTLVGYSINDTIVVFDRVRENLRLMRRSDLATVINASINQTLNRTIMTSGMTFLAVFALYLFGGQVLRGFSLALVVGIIIGTYSSVAIASPIVLWWQIHRDRRVARA